MSKIRFSIQRAGNLGLSALAQVAPFSMPVVALTLALSGCGLDNV
ncbi:MAG: hypothetical protein RQ982_02820 [Gammaproteobacteria bacterium]|nr:hypothetical protein [Gammaproteobacteria bacterium]